MIAHLQNGRFGDAQILRPETAALMHSRVFSADDRMNGMAHGFYEESANGHRIIGHGGDTRFFHSDLHLIPDANVGFFVSYNSAGKGEVSPRGILFEKFLDRYFPYSPGPVAKIENAKADAELVSGLYLNSRRFENSFLKLTSLLGEIKVLRNSDGTISIALLKEPNGEPRKFEEIAPLLYREVHGQHRVAFKRDSNGELQFQLDFPPFIFQRVSFRENKLVNYLLLTFSLGVMAFTILLWPVAAIARKHYGRPLELNPSERKLRLVARIIILLNLVFVLGWLLALSRAEDPGALNSLAPWIITLGIQGVLCVFGILPVGVNAYRSWSAPGRWIWTKLHDTALVLACAGLAWFAFTWKLLNFNLHF